MKWLRSRPTDFNELDEVAIWERARTVGQNKEGDAEEDMDALDEEDEVGDEEAEDGEDGEGGGEQAEGPLDGFTDSRRPGGKAIRGKGRRRNGDEGGTKVG